MKWGPSLSILRQKRCTPWPEILIVSMRHFFQRDLGDGRVEISLVLKALQYAVSIAFISLGVLTVRDWLSGRDRRRGYLALALGLLGVTARWGVCRNWTTTTTKPSWSSAWSPSRAQPTRFDVPAYVHSSVARGPNRGGGGARGGRPLRPPGAAPRRPVRDSDRDPDRGHPRPDYGLGRLCGRAQRSVLARLPRSSRGAEAPAAGHQPGVLRHRPDPDRGGERGFPEHHRGFRRAGRGDPGGSDPVCQLCPTSLAAPDLARTGGGALPRRRQRAAALRSRPSDSCGPCPLLGRAPGRGRRRPGGGRQRRAPRRAQHGPRARPGNRSGGAADRCQGG